MSDEVDFGDGIHCRYDGDLVHVRMTDPAGDQHLVLEPKVLKLLMLGALEIGRRNAAAAATPASPR